MVILPELYLLAYAIFFLLASLGKEKKNLLLWARSGAALGLVISVLSLTAQGELFGGAYRVDLFSQVFKVLIILGFFLVVATGGNQGDAPREYQAEYFLFLGLSTLGLLLLVSSVELISIVLALEISSFSLYVLVPLRRAQTPRHLEGAVKYMFFGALATGLMLYGMGYLYGLAQSTFLVDIGEKLASRAGEPLVIFALLLVLAGFFFKLSLFPLHFWTPDIYEGSSNSTATFIASVPKVAAAALMIRFVQALPHDAIEFTAVLIVLAAVSMTLGNLVGLVQKDLKRLLAYSGIAHAGYLMLGLLAGDQEGYGAVIFYSFVYLFMNLGAFYVILLLRKDGENPQLTDLVGLSRRSPLLALTLATSAFALAGIPPTGGFTGKFFLFVSAFEAGHLGIVIVGAVNTVLSIFYYLNLVRLSYSQEPADTAVLLLTRGQKILCGVYVLALLYLGILPWGFLHFFTITL
jgi:NADH-quinone oxidoreductase subunit N